MSIDVDQRRMTKKTLMGSTERIPGEFHWATRQEPGESRAAADEEAKGENSLDSFFTLGPKYVCCASVEHRGS
jgi:hypothetical protein